MIRDPGLRIRSKVMWNNNQDSRNYLPCQPQGSLSNLRYLQAGPRYLRASLPSLLSHPHHLCHPQVGTWGWPLWNLQSQFSTLTVLQLQCQPQSLTTHSPQDTMEATISSLQPQDIWYNSLHRLRSPLQLCPSLKVRFFYSYFLRRLQNLKKKSPNLIWQMSKSGRFFQKICGGFLYLIQQPPLPQLCPSLKINFFKAYNSCFLEGHKIRKKNTNLIWHLVFSNLKNIPA